MADATKADKRAAREKKTVGTMVEIFCKAHHDGRRERSLCSECEELLNYAKERIDSCPLLDDKPTCAKCPVHCYDDPMRDRIRRVMRYSGPRMMLSHPVLSTMHMSDSRRGRKSAKR